MRYKLIKDYPNINYNVGDIHDDSTNFVDCRNYPEHWAAFCFVTDDNIEMFEGETYYGVQTFPNDNFQNQVQTFKISGFPNVISDLWDGVSTYQKNNGVRGFSTKEAAEKFIKEQEFPKYVKILSTGCHVSSLSTSKEPLKLNHIYKVLGRGSNRIYQYCLHLETNDGYIQIASPLPLIPTYIKKVIKEEYEAQNKSKFKVGEWIWFKNDAYKGIFRFEKEQNNEVYGTEYYYLNNITNLLETGISVGSDGCSSIDNCIKATPEQIERILVAVAKHKGFKEGVKCTSLSSTRIGTISKSQKYISGKDSLWFSSNDATNRKVYSKGKWATVIEEPKATFGGKEVTFKIEDIDFHFGVIVSVNRKGSKMSLESFQKLYDSFKFIHNGFKFRNHGIESIGDDSLPDTFDDMVFTIGCTEGTIRELKNIIEQGNKFKNDNKT